MEEKDKTLIPTDTPYCYEPIEYNEETGVLKTKPCPYWQMKYNNEFEADMEYCDYLRDFLDVQDQVKDCEIE